MIVRGLDFCRRLFSEGFPFSPGRLGLWAVLFVTWALPVPAVTPLKVELFPPQLALRAGEEEHVWMRILNGSGEPIEGLDLRRCLQIRPML